MSTLSSSNLIENSPINNTPQHDANSTSSYVNAAKSRPPINFPKKEQAIIMNVDEELSRIDYVKSIGKIVGPKNIIFASRISNDRVCMYLSSVQTVENLITKYKSININGINIGIRKLITPSKRVIISNVCPSIPHEIVEEALKKVGLKLVSSLSFLRAGFQDDEYNHILSFRRHVYVTPDEQIQLTPSLVINYEDTNYRIFLTYDDLTCFICGRQGHISSTCSAQQPAESQTPMDTEEHRHKRPPPSESLDTPPADGAVQSPQYILKNPNKTQTPDPFQKPTNMPKKPRMTDPEPNLDRSKPSSSTESLQLDVDIEPIKLLIEKKPKSFPVTYNVFKSFLENCKGNPDPLSEAKRCSNDVEALLQMMYDLYPHLPNKAAKSKFTRIQKKIKNQMTPNELENSKSLSQSTCSLISQDSQDEY